MWLAQCSGKIGDAIELYCQKKEFSIHSFVTAVDRLTGLERKRQDSIAELMNTEQAYIDDMAVVHEVGTCVFLLFIRSNVLHTSFRTMHRSF